MSGSNVREAEFLAACKEGNLSAVNHFIGMGVDVNSFHPMFGMTGLHLASKHGHSDVVRELVRRSANINVKNKYDNTPLHLATESGHIATVCALIEGSATLNVQNKSGKTPLHFCCRDGNAAIAKVLLQNGADSTVLDKNGKTAQMLAERNGHLHVQTLFHCIEASESERRVTSACEVCTRLSPPAVSVPHQSCLEPEEDSCECRVCFELPSAMVFVPCGHMCACEDCARQLQRCPICRCIIEKSVKLYRA